MLQAVMANPANRGDTMNSAPDYRRAALVLGAVIVAHLTLLALTLAARNSMVERRVEPRTITAVLLSPEPEPVTPAAAPAVPTTPAVPAAHPAAHSVARVKPAPQPRPHVAPPLPHAPSSVATPAPSAPAESAAPSAPARPAEAATEAPAAPAPVPAPAAPPAMPASAAPKNVSHVDCTIPKPDYPDVSRRRGENGTAIVRFVVGLTGRIETAQLQSSSGSARLDEAALAAVHAGACRPYLENGTPLRAAYSQSFVFGLSE